MKDRITFELNKLVRDKIYDDMVESGQVIVGRKLQGEQLEEALLDKLVEEAKELRSGDDDSPVDITSALLAYISLKRLSFEYLLGLVRQKEQERGGFSEGRFVATVSLDAEDPWVGYYRKDPERYREIE